MADYPKRTETVQARTVSVRAFQLHTYADEPNRVRDIERRDERDIQEVISRMMVNAARVSYIVDGPNREVYWMIAMFCNNHGRWEMIAEGKSKLRDRVLANTNPYRTDRAKYPRELG